ncbi:MAG TPA: peptidylprolyl isomerase [Vicinamibacteria bacterium]
MLQPSLRNVLPSLLLLLAAVPARAEILERVVAKVNGDIVTLTDFQARQLAAAQSARISPDRIEAFLRQQNAKILQDAVDELLLTQRANDLGMRMRPEVVREIIEGIKKENNLETDAELTEQLRREGMSMDDLKRSIERSIQRRQVLQREIEPKIAVSEEDSYAEYLKKKADFSKPATVTLEEILVDGQDAQEKAQVLVGRARAGEDFSALARAYSKAPSAKNGGELGKLAHGEMNPQLEKEAFALAKGAISEPIPQGEGFRILKVADRTEASVVPYEEAKKDIRARLGEERIQKEYQTYMDTLRLKAVIQIQVREVPLQLSGPVPENALLDTPLLGGGGASMGLGATPEAGAASAPASAQPAAVPVAAPPKGDEEAEFTTEGSAKPERVAPPPPPGAGVPKEDETKPAPPPHQ